MTDLQHPAARLAALHPESTLPCPICAATVKGANLDRHLGKVHPGRRIDGASAERSWRGPERLIARALAAVAALPLIALAAAIWAEVDIDDVIILSTVVATGSALILIGLVLAGAPLFHGRLAVEGPDLVLSHTLGLGRRRLRRVDRLDAGSAYLVRSSGSNSEGVGGTRSEERAGAYLRARAGRGYITVRCQHSAGLRKTWTGWDQGRRTRRWHVTLDPVDFVGLQYALLELGLLTLRGRDSV